MLFMLSEKLGLDQENAHQQIEKVLTSTVILWAGANCIFHVVGGPSSFMWVYIGYQARKGLHTGTVKINPHKFCHLKYPCNSHIFKIYQIHLFLFGETKKIENSCIGFFQVRKLLQ